MPLTEGTDSTYEYDIFGRIIKESLTNGAEKVYTYDMAGNRISFVIKKDNAVCMNVTYAYDKLDRLSSVTSGNHLTSYTYDRDGRITGSTTDGFTTAMSYNMAGLVSAVNTQKGSTAVQSHSYVYRPDGNISSKQSTVGAGTVSYAYAYDNAGRLVGEQFGENTKTYVYDAFGNRAGMNVNGNAYTYSHDANNRLTSVSGSGTAVTYAYDDNGNLVTKTGEETETYAYDKYNRLKGYTKGTATAAYTYDGNNLRQTKTVNGIVTTHVWDGTDIVADVKGTSVSKYYRGADGILYSETETGVSYYQKDAHGDVTAIVSAEAAIIKPYVYDAFGNEEAEETDQNPFRYCGEYLDSETGLIYLRNRYYDPKTGSFITEDPIKDGDNWYTYCNGNPVMFTDPSGENPVDEIVSWMEGKKKGIIEFKTSGFLYASSQGIYYSVATAWQRKYGYCDFYDSVANKFINIDTVKVYFNYNDYDWRIQLWKGDYGPSTGCEIGLYYRNKDTKIDNWYQAVNWDDMLEMSLYLKKDNKMLFYRNPVTTWWLTAFKMDGGAKPSELTMGMTITFKDREMRNKFIESFNNMYNERLEIQFSTDINDQKIWIEWSK